MRRQKRRAQTVAFYLDSMSKDLILDLGCGEGFVTSHFLDGRFVVGLDNSKDSLLTAKQKIRRSNIDFIRADITALPLKTASFDKITLLEVLEHLPEENHGTLGGEIDRILKTGGTLVVSFPYKEQITYTEGKPTSIWGHLYSMDKEKITSLLPDYYTLTSSVHLPNVELASLSRIFAHLPLKLWLVLNNSLGKFRKGYWIILKYKKKKIDTKMVLE